MSLLSSFIVADGDAGYLIGASAVLSNDWTCLEGWKGVEPVKLSTLYLICAESQPSTDDTVALSEEFDLVGGNEGVGPWVLQVPSKLVATVASLPASDVDARAEAWCATEELQMDGWTSIDAKAFISAFQSLCQSTVSSGKSMFLKTFA